MHTPPPFRISLLTTGLLLLTACGGGGGGGGGSTPPVPVPPTPGTSVVVSGKITFDSVPHNTTSNGLDYNSVTQKPARAVTVQALSSANAVLASTTTDANGNYSLTVNANTDMSLRVLAEMKKSGSAPNWDFMVVDNTSNGAEYSLAGATFNSGSANMTRDVNAPSGWNGTSYAAPRSAAPFAILDAVYQAYNKVLSAAPATQFPALKLNWSVNNTPSDGNIGQGEIGTTYYENDQIYILGQANNDTDEYDDHVVIHEWGHYFEDNFSRADSIGGQHSGADKLDMRVAFGEGWGNAWSGIATDDPMYRDSSGTSQSQGFSINVDNNNPSNKGWYSEASIQAILYDLYDAGTESGDPVSLGFKPLYDIMTTSQKNTAALTSIFSLIPPLKSANPAQGSAIDILVTGQNIVSTTMDIWGSTETNSGGNTDSLPVYVTYGNLGVAQSVCVNSSEGNYNKLGNNRPVRVTLPSDGDYTITLTRGFGGSDPDFEVYQGRLVAQAFSQAAPSESRQVTLKAGTAVVVVTEADSAVTGRICMNLTVN